VSVTRRLVIRTVPTLAGALVLGCGGGNPPAADAGGETELRVPLSALAVGSFVALGDGGCSGATQGAIVGRDDRGVYAFARACTHQHGTVAVPDATGTATCCLHGATYDVNGDVVKGVVPDQAPLPHWAVRLEGAEVVVTVGLEVSDRTNRLHV
jgi:Rieske Fe-S protein